MAGQSEVRAWLIQEAGISAERIDALLQVLNEEEVDTVNDLQILSNAPRFDIRLTAVTGQKIRDALARRPCDTASAPLITPSAAKLQPPAADGNLSGRASEALLAAGALALASRQSPPPSASSGELAAALLPARAAPTPPIAVNKAKRPTHVACFGCQLQHPSTPTDQLTQLPAPSKGAFKPADRICEQCHTSGLRIARPRVHGVKFLTELQDPGGKFKTEPWFCLKDYGTSPPLAYTNSCSPTKIDSAAEKRCSVIILKNEADWPSVLEVTMDSGKVVRRTLGEKLVEIPLQWFDDDRLCFVWSGRAEQFILGRSTTRKRKADALTDQSAAQLLVPPPPADTPALPAQLAAASAASWSLPQLVAAALAEGCPDLDDVDSDYDKDQAGYLKELATSEKWLAYLLADVEATHVGASGGGVSGSGASGGGASDAGASSGGSSGGGASGGDPSGSGGAAFRSLGGADEGEVPPVMRSLGSEGDLEGPAAFTSLGGTDEADEAEEDEEISELLEQVGEHLRYGALRAAKAVLRRVKALKGM